MFFRKFPIISCCDGDEEITSPQQFADHAASEFENVEKIKQKGIKRCYIIFYDNPENNDFLKTLDVVFVFHAGSVTTKVFEYKNALIAISPLGGPSAASLMEELALFGIREFVAVGSAGCLQADLKDKFVLVEKAVRDEGTSYHYLKPSTYVETDRDLCGQVENFLTEKQFEFVKATTWTNDAYYRETKQKVAMAKKLGAVAVEMECASWCAVAKCRGFKFAQLLYFSDLVNQDAWTRLIKQKKGYHTDRKDVIVLLVKDMIDDYSK